MSHVREREKLVVSALAAALACFALSAWLSGRVAFVTAARAGQTAGYKTVEIDPQYRMEPVTIDAVTVGGQKVPLGVTAGWREMQPATPFQGGDDWLKNMSIVLKNRTNKTVVRVELDLFFPQTGDGRTQQQAITYCSLHLGLRPAIDSFTNAGKPIPQDPNQLPLAFAPAQTLVVQVGNYANEIRAVVEPKLPVSQITKCAIRRIGFFFEDGMRWTDLDGFGIPNPNHPGQFTSLGRRYFPGNPTTNWPPSDAPFQP